jgi:hypothetical protein
MTALTIRLNGFAFRGIRFPPGENGSCELAAKHGHSLAGNPHAIAYAPRADKSSACGSLESDEIVAAQALLPERAQAAVGRARDRVFVNAERGREKPRDVVIVGAGSAARDDHAARLQPPQTFEVRLERAHNLFAARLHQVVETRSAHVAGLYSQRGFQNYGRGVGFRRRGREIHFDPSPLLLCRQQAGSSMKARWLIGMEVALLPEKMRARESGMAA